MVQPRRTKPSAFTLIELLVVIAIIALFISILLPSLSRAREMAKGTVCKANLKRVGTAMQVYLGQYGDKFPPFRLKKASPRAEEAYFNKFKRVKPRWQWFVDSSVGPVIDPGPFRDEIGSSGTFGDGSVGVNGESGREMTNEYFLCPSLDHEFERDVRNGAYGYNYQYLGNSLTTTDPNRWDNYPVVATRIRASQATVLIADSRGADQRHGKHSYSLDPPRLAIERNATKFGPGESDVSAGLDGSLFRFSPVEMRHGKRGNVLFIDTHVDAMTHEDLGYQLTDRGVPEPILDPERGTHIATNKLWNGRNIDPMASRSGR